MPKIVDHEALRGELAEALCRVLAREGVAAVTIRSVAAEAGWTRGRAEHYFAGKEAMLAYAYEMAGERALASVRASRSGLAGREALRAVLLEGLPQGDDHVAATGLWFALLAAAGHEPALAAELVRFDGAMRVEIAEIVAEMLERGELSSQADAAAIAQAVLGFTLGLGMGVRMQPEGYTGEVVAAEVERFLARLCGA